MSSFAARVLDRLRRSSNPIAKYLYKYFRVNGPYLTDQLRKRNIPGAVESIRASNAKVLHLVPANLNLPELKYHGSTKDIRGRTEYFVARALSADEFCLHREDRVASESMGLFHDEVRDLRKYEVIIVDIPGTFPKLIATLKRLAPNARVLFRAHNAEYFHRMDYFRAETASSRRLKYLFAAIRGLIGDLRMVHSADAILSISTWDTENYWRKLAALSGQKSKIIDVPYFLPDSLLPTRKPGAKENICVCLGVPHKPSPLIRDSLTRFVESVEKLPSDVRASWRFTATGHPVEYIGSSKAIEFLGFLETPFDALLGGRAMCLLSDLGRGFKTKILDAAVSDAFTIVPRELYGRLPVLAKPVCIELESVDSSGLEEALMAASKEFPSTDVNRRFRDLAFSSLDSVFGAQVERTEIETKFHASYSEGPAQF